MYGHRSRVSRRRRGRRAGARSTGSHGSAARLMPVLRAPRISVLETRLDSLGVPVQRFKQFRYEERVSVNTRSGRCHWYAVPQQMETGTLFQHSTVAGTSASPDFQAAQRSSIAVNTADLFDIYRHLLDQRAVGSTSFQDSRDPMFAQWIPAVTGAETLDATPLPRPYSSLVPGGFRSYRPGLDYTMRTHITYDNMSSLDAYVEVYKLTYSGKNDNGPNIHRIGQDLTATEINRHPGMTGARFVYNYDAYASEFCVPLDNTTSVKSEYQSALFGGALLKTFGQVLCYNRYGLYGAYAVGTGDAAMVVDGDVQGRDVMPRREGEGRNTTDGAGLPSKPEDWSHMLCHPKVDPLKVLPTHTLDMCGFKMERVRSAQRIAPGGSSRFDIPNEGTKHWDYFTSVHGRRLRTATMPDVDVPKTVVYCFRVWGDMVHSAVALDDNLETDFMTGSTSLSFSTQRVCWARSKPRYFTTVVPQVLPFDAEIVGAQEHINDETNLPSLIKRAGDDGIVPDPVPVPAP